MRRIVVAFVVAIVGTLALLVALKRMPYSSSSISQVDDSDGAPSSDGAMHVGPLSWDLRTYQAAESLEPFRALLHEHCPSLSGVDAAVCLSLLLNEKIPMGNPAHEFVDVDFDPAAVLADHMGGQAGHCVSRSAIVATTLLATGTPARVIQELSTTDGTGHNVVEVWSAGTGWVQIDPTNEGMLMVDDKPGSTVEGRASVSVRQVMLDSHLPAGPSIEKFVRGAILLPDPWLYTRVGKSAAPWPMRGAFVRSGNIGAWSYGRAQDALRAGILVCLAIGAVAFGAGLRRGVARLRSPALRPRAWTHGLPVVQRLLGMDPRILPMTKHCPTCGHEITSDSSPPAHAGPPVESPLSTSDIPELVVQEGDRVQRTAELVEASVSPPAGESVLPPGTSVFREFVLSARQPGGTAVLCVRCRADVRFDGFRRRQGDGFLCTECQDDIVDRSDRLRVRVKRTATIVGIATLAIALFAGSIVLGTHGGSRRPPKEVVSKH